MSKKENLPIQAFNQLKFEHNELEKFKQKFDQQHRLAANKYGEYYIGHPNLNLLCCFLLFAFADEKVLDMKKCKTVMKRLFQKEDQLKIIRSKFYLGWDNKKSLVQCLQQRSNSIASNKVLLLQKCDKLKEDQWVNLMKTVFGGMSKYIACKLTTENGNQDIVFSNDPNIYLTILVTKEKSYLIFYQKQSDKLISSEITDNEQKRQKQEQIEIRNSIRDSKQEQIPIDNQNGRKSVKIGKSQTMQETSGGETQIQTRDSKQIKKSLSEGDKDAIVDSVEEIQKNDCTWFEAFILVIILATLLAGCFNYFDPFLKDYNAKIGRYYLLDAGYKFVNYTVEMANKFYSQI